MFIMFLKNNILSLGQLLEKGYDVEMKDMTLSIRDKNKTLISHVKMARNRMFPLHLSIFDQSNCFKADIEDISTLWHLRYAHLNFEALKLLEKYNMVTGMPKIDRPAKLCEVCVMGKQERKPFKVRRTKRAWHRLDLVHSDVCGPINPVTLRGSRYFLTFIDDHSGKT